MKDRPENNSQGIFGLLLTVVATLFVLAALPVLQMYLVDKSLGIDGLKVYLTSPQPAFYQFVLAALTVLVAIAGYLTYRNQRDAREEAEREKKDWKNQCERVRVEQAGLLSEFKSKENAVKSLIADAEQNYARLKDEADEVRCFLTNTKAQIADDAQNAHRDITENTEKVHALFAMKQAEISGRQLAPSSESAIEKRARTIFDEGFVAYERDDKDTAKLKWAEALRLKPDYYQAWYNLGLVQAIKSDYDDAIVSLVKAIRLRPDDPDSYDTLGIVFGLKKDYDSAIAANNDAIRLKPDYADAYYNLGYVFALQSNVEESAKNLSRAISLDSKYRDKARKDSDFDSVRNDTRIVELLGKPPYE